MSLSLVMYVGCRVGQIDLMSRKIDLQAHGFLLDGHREEIVGGKSQMLISQALATDPIFKLIPRASLIGLPVQNNPLIDLEMIVGTSTGTPTVFRVNGPMTGGHAGMTVKSFVKNTKGSNVNSPDFDTAKTTMSATSNDGLQDAAAKSFTQVSRVTSSTTTTSYNKVTMLATMTVVDTPGKTSSDTLWMWASAEVGDEYVWVGEEKTTVARVSSDRAYLGYTTSVNGGAAEGTITGAINVISGTIKHLPTSRINAYQTVLRFFLPPHATYVTNSYQGNSTFSIGKVEQKSSNGQNELIIQYPKIGITDTPSYSFHVRLEHTKLKLAKKQSHQGGIPFVMSYCSQTPCTTIQETFKKTITEKFRNRLQDDTFKVKYLPTGRCLSYTAGSDSDKVTLKGSCTDYFTYDEHGGLKHVTTSACAYFDTNGDLKMHTSKCNSIDAAVVVKLINGNLQMVMPPRPVRCIVATSSGAEGGGMKNLTCSTSNNYFRYINMKPPQYRTHDIVGGVDYRASLRTYKGLTAIQYLELPATGRLSISDKVVLHDSSGKLFFCSRHKPISRPSCYYKTDSSGWHALPPTLTSIKAYHSSSETVYGLHSSGMSYVMIQLGHNPTIITQIEDSLWESVKSGCKLATDVSQASLGTAVTQVESSGYAVSLKGLHKATDSTRTAWVLISRW
eukprot:gene5919-6605_t